MQKLKTYFQPIMCVILLIILLALPFVDNDYGYGVSNSFTGFTMAAQTYIGYLLFLLPILLLSISFSPKYETAKPKLSLLIPALCIISWLITVIYAKLFIASVADSSLSVGAYSSLICCIILEVYAVLTYRSTAKELLESLKNFKK
ncbi:MAG: hypothetical protein IKW59_05975 [Clostridia bacterium]|nr:hypothetical protein [Clostridia bacterium]